MKLMAVGGWFREPLVWFFLVGLVLLVINGLRDGNERDDLIEVNSQIEAHIADQWETQMGRPPTIDEMKGLIDQWIKDEIYYREAIRLGLANNDTIVRRRLVQKLTFLTDDIATAQEPTDSELYAYYTEHQESYVEPVRYSFRHRYFSSDRREQAQKDANAALEKIKNGTEAEFLGDSFMLQMAFIERSDHQIADLFGQEYAESLGEVVGDDWVGPVRSVYGWHLVQIQARTPIRVLSFQEARFQLVSDLTLVRQQAANDAYYENLRSRYRIVQQ
jgi:peptidyl-prolyl cis-trans isomerase C